MNNPKVFGLILAGGESRRIKTIAQDKFLLQIGQKTLIEHCITVLQKSISTIHISSNNFKAIEQSLSDHFLENISTSSDGQFLGCGPLAGIYSALYLYKQKELNEPFTHALCIPADSPFISKKVIDNLILEGRKNPSKIITCADPKKTHYACSLWPVSLTTDLKNYLLQEKRSIKGFFKEQDTKTIFFDNKEKWFFNINTPEDYSYAKKLFKSIKNE